jgi:Amt family ammonium transporter
MAAQCRSLGRPRLLRVLLALLAALAVALVAAADDATNATATVVICPSSQKYDASLDKCVDSVSCPSSQYYDATVNKCVDFESRGAKAGEDHSAELDSGNTAWMLTASAMVMIMTPGMSFFYAGLAGDEMASNTIMMSFVSIAVVSIQYFAFGYSATFSSDGIFGWAGYHDVGQVPSGTYGQGIPHCVYALYMTQFAMITPAMLSGGIVGRMKFGAFLLFVLLWTSTVYDPLARWMWALKLDDSWAITALGWEGKLGSLDFAGGTVIHVSSGCGSLVAALVVGKRYNHGEPVRPHNIPLVMIGATLLWFGWYGFNAGSAGAADKIASIAAINTHLGGCAGFLTWIAIEYAVSRKFDPCGAASGALGGLVGITPGCGYVHPWAAVLFGIVGSTTAFWAIQLKNKLRYDDTLDSFALHACAGFMGGIMTGLFATNEVNPNIEGGAFYGHPELLWHQLVSLVVAAAYSSVVTFILLMLLKYTVGLRVDEEKEVRGIDISYHGGLAYDYSAHGPHMNGSPNFKAANPPEGGFESLMTPMDVGNNTSVETTVTNV